MKKILLTFITIALLSSCGSEEKQEAKDVDLNRSLQMLSEELNEEIPVWDYHSFQDQFEIEVPSQMEATTKLNPVAELQFKYAEQFEGEVKENYIIVLSDIYENSVPTDDSELMEYAQQSLDTLMIGKKSFEVLNEPKVESVNGMNMVSQEVKANISLTDSTQLDLLYITGIYQGKKAHYQIISWTVLDQKDDFAQDMRRMVYSFKEIN